MMTSNDVHQANSRSMNLRAPMIATVGVNVVFAVIDAVYASMHQPGEARNP
jgi:hypothetical protein